MPIFMVERTMSENVLCTEVEVTGGESFEDYLK